MMRLIDRESESARKNATARAAKCRPMVICLLARAQITRDPLNASILTIFCKNRVR